MQLPKTTIPLQPCSPKQKFENHWGGGGKKAGVKYRTFRLEEIPNSDFTHLLGISFKKSIAVEVLCILIAIIICTFKLAKSL